MGKTSIKAVNKYIAKAYDRVNLTVPKGKKEIYRKQAEKRGMSLNAYINYLLEQNNDNLNCVIQSSDQTDN